MRRETWRTTLLGCGIASSLMYAAMIWGIRYEGYSVLSQVPSELTAIGAPTRTLWMWLGPIYTVLVAAFGVGVWRSAGGNRAVRITGGLILAYASLGVLWPFAAMHQREVLAAGGGTLGDAMHVVLGAATVFLMFVTIGFGAAAFGTPFRLYSIASVVVLLGFGALTFIEAPLLATTVPTPWIGLWERINISVFLLWVAVLATIVWGSDCVPTSSDLSRVMAGDALLDTWTYSGTLAVDVDAAHATRVAQPRPRTRGLGTTAHARDPARRVHHDAPDAHRPEDARRGTARGDSRRTTSRGVRSFIT